MAEKTRSSIIGIKEESTEGTLIELAAGSEFIKIREGFSVQGAVETVDSDALVNGIGASASFVTKESPTSSIPNHLKHSGVEGQAPEVAVMIKSAIGSQVNNATEYDTVAGSTAGTSAAASILNVDSGEGANFAVGQAVLIKDGSNGYSIRNIKEINTDALTLNYNLANAPASGVNLGKAVHFAPSPDGHPTYSLHHYQSGTASSSLHQAVSGCRTTSMSMTFPVNDLATIDFDIEGVKFFYNPMVVSAANNKINFIDVTAGLELTATLTNKTYQTPKELAAEVSTKVNAAGTNGDVLSCSFDSNTGKFTIETDGTELELLWKTGANGSDNTDTHAGSLLGYSDAADDDDAATEYTSDNEQTYDTSLTPAYDSSTEFVVKNQELVIGNFARNDCRSNNSVSISISTPKTDVEDMCAASGVSSSVILEREVTVSTTLIFEKHEVDEFNDMINNTTSQLMFNAGEKGADGNWIPGKCFNFSMPNMKILSNTIADGDGIIIVEVEAKGFVTSDQKDMQMNFL